MLGERLLVPFQKIPCSGIRIMGWQLDDQSCTCLTCLALLMMDCCIYRITQQSGSTHAKASWHPSVLFLSESSARALIYPHKKGSFQSVFRFPKSGAGGPATIDIIQPALKRVQDDIGSTYCLLAHVRGHVFAGGSNWGAGGYYAERRGGVSNPVVVER